MCNKFFNICLLTVLIAFPVNTTVQADNVTPMTPISLQQWYNKLQSYQPNIVIVDIWAMWCTSCIERFPEMVKLYQRYKTNNAVFVSLNLDDRNDTESIAAANRFLQKMDATFEHYHMDENLMLTFEKLNLIGIPAVLIYNQQGEEQFRLTGDNPNKQFTHNDIEVAIQTLIKQ